MEPGREGYPVGALFALKTAGLDEEGYPMFGGKDGKAVSAMEFFKLQEWGFGATDLTARERRELYTYVGTADCLIQAVSIILSPTRLLNWVLTSASTSVERYAVNPPTLSLISTKDVTRTVIS